MQQIGDGVYAVEGAMPCKPRDIKVGYYTLPGTLLRAEREEAAARIIRFSQELDRWVGVSWTRLVQMMEEDILVYKKMQEYHKHNGAQLGRINQQLAMYRVLSVLTLGIYTLFVKKPVPEFRDIPKQKIPSTGIFIDGQIHVAVGIRELVERGMLERVSEGEGEDLLDVLFPTPLLISTIMQKQGLVNA